MKKTVPTGGLSEHCLHIFPKAEGHNPLATVRCFPLLVHNTDQSKDLAGNCIIFLETFDELVKIIESKRINLFLIFSIEVISVV